MARVLIDYDSGDYPCNYFIGNKGQGKSVHADTKLLVRINGKTTRIKIKELENIFNSHSSIEVPAITKDRKVIWSKVKHVWKHEPEHSLYKVTTNSYNTIIATADHSLLTVDKNDQIKSIKTIDIRKDDLIPSLHGSINSNMSKGSEKVVSIEKMAGKESFVYDLETNEHNFMLSNGLFVHNSVIVEHVAERFFNNGYQPFDLFDAYDWECAFWGIRHCVKCNRAIRYDQKVCPKCGLIPKAAHQVLLVVPDGSDFAIGDPNFHVISSEEGLERIARTAINKKYVVSMATKLFDKEDLFYTLAEWLQQWMQLNDDNFHKDTVLVMREAANIAFARHKLYENQSKLRKSIFEFIRFARHYQTVILLDTQRFMDLDIGTRDNLENIVIKRHSEQSMPDLVKEINKEIQGQRWKWYRAGMSSDKINSKRPEIPYLRKNEYYCKFYDGSFSFGKNGFPTFHHKTTKDKFKLLTDATYSTKLFSYANEESNVKRINKSTRMKLATDMITDGMDEDDVAKYLQTRPSTVRKWVEEYQLKYAKAEV